MLKSTRTPVYDLLATMQRNVLGFFVVLFIRLYFDTEISSESVISILTFLKPTGYVMHHQFNIQQMYALPTLYLCVLYLSENKQRLVLLTA